MDCPYTPGMDLKDVLARMYDWAERLGAYVVLHVLDDPAWLALIFC